MNNPHIAKIKSRGHWRVVIRPLQFDVRRISNVRDLEPTLRRAQVSLRGWAFPAIDPHEVVEIGEDWICQSIDWSGHVEYWRFFQSGQFIHLDGFKEDWVEESEFYGPGKTWGHGERLGILGALYRLTEIFEFASRLSLTQGSDVGLSVSIGLTGLSNRRLWWEDRDRRGFNGRYAASLDKFEFEDVIPCSTLIANAWDIAADQSIELFNRFGWSPPREVIVDMQGKLRRWSGWVLSAVPT